MWLAERVLIGVALYWEQLQLKINKHPHSYGFTRESFYVHVYFT